MKIPTNRIGTAKIINVPRSAKRERKVHFAEEPEYLIQSVAPKLPYIDLGWLELIPTDQDNLYGRGVRQLKCLWAEAGVKLGFNDAEIKALVCLMMSVGNLSQVARLYPELFAGDDVELHYQLVRYVGAVCEWYCEYSPELLEWFDETYGSLLQDGTVTRAECADNVNYNWYSRRQRHHTIRELSYSSDDDDSS